ncbi:MAG: hypothetical protein RMJ55_00990, partial [Roseiflexaceae bacterium]|nr:hypothetical protein [Roseiflexaceae bacterium]
MPVTLNPRVITYQDELLADGSVRRVFSDGRQEWRRRLPDGRVEWRDNQGYAGIDELLGDGILKRTFNQGQVIYAREQGYGRTLWHRGQVLTVNQTSFGGRVGAILTSMGAGFLLGSLVLPPEYLSPEEEEMLRQKMLQQKQQIGSSGGWGGGSEWDSGDSDSDWDQPEPVTEGATSDSGSWGGDSSSFDG